MSEDFKKFRNEYQKIGHLPCPAFNSENIYFNKHGLIHLFIKGRFPRKSGDIVRRIRIFPNVKVILNNENKITEYRTTRRGLSTAHFWTIKSKINNRIIKVIIRQLNNGRKHFFSVMDEK